MSTWEYCEQAMVFRKISSDAGSAWFGLFSYLNGGNRKIDKERLEFFRRTLKNGVAVCELFQDAIEVILSDKDKIDLNKLPGFHLFKPVRAELEEAFGSIANILVEAEKTKVFLTNLLEALENQSKTEYLPAHVRERQRFFDKVSLPYLKVACLYLRKAVV